MKINKIKKIVPVLLIPSVFLGSLSPVVSSFADVSPEGHTVDPFSVGVNQDMQSPPPPTAPSATQNQDEPSATQNQDEPSADQNQDKPSAGVIPQLAEGVTDSLTNSD